MTSEDDELSRVRAERAAARLRAAAAALTDHDQRSQDADVAALLETVTEQIRRESRAGRDVMLGSSETDRRLTVTEGALRAAVRSAVDDVPDVLVGRVRLRGDLDDARSAIGAELRISVRWRAPLRPAVDAAREAVARALAAQTGRPAAAVDITVVDIHAVGSGVAGDTDVGVGVGPAVDEDHEGERP